MELRGRRSSDKSIRWQGVGKIVEVEWGGQAVDGDLLSVRKGGGEDRATIGLGADEGNQQPRTMRTTSSLGPDED